MFNRIRHLRVALALFCWLAGCAQTPPAAAGDTLPVDAKNGSDGAAASSDATGKCGAQACDDGDPCTDDGCDAAGACVHGPKPGCGSMPIPCAQASDCAKGACDLTLHSCVDCQTTADCGGSGFCVNAKCIAGVACASDGVCKASHQVCNSTVGFCVDCTSAADCASGQLCLGNKCAAKPTQCASSKDCPGSQVCSGGACMACAAATDCGAGQTCQAGTCVAKVCAVPVCVGASVWKCNSDGTGYAAAPESCDDGQDCTTDGCAPGIGCAHALTTSPVCGNGTCDCGETRSGCPADCPEPAMINLAAGTYSMGWPTQTYNGVVEPEHQVTLGAFQLDKSEVTVASYSAFYYHLSAQQQCAEQNLNKFECGRPVNVDPDQMPYCNWGVADRGAHPINCVDWYQASAYCAWSHVGGRLPSEAEWEYAARSGGKTQAFPSGNTADANLGGMTGTWAVCSNPTGNSAQGACDLAGNVAEWCADWFSVYTAGAQVNPTGPSSGSARAVRGGSWAANIGSVVARDSWGPTTRFAAIGFRCARTL